MMTCVDPGNDDRVVIQCPRSKFIDFNSPMCLACAYNYQGACEYDNASENVTDADNAAE